MTTKKLSEETEQNPSEPHSLAVLFKVYLQGAIAYSSCHEKHPMDVHGWVFTLYLRFCVWSLPGKNISFSVSNSQFFLSNICLQCYQQKNKEKSWRKLIRFHIKTRPPITWLSDVTRQILKCTQGKQIFSILYHIDCLSKYLLE